jgi:hypothetical protein
MMNQQMTTVELLRQRQFFPLQTTATLFQGAGETLKRPFQDLNSNHLQTLQNGIYPNKRLGSGGTDPFYGRENRGFGAVVDNMRISKEHLSPKRAQGFPRTTNHVTDHEPLLPMTELDLVRDPSYTTNRSVIPDGNFQPLSSKPTIAKASDPFTSGKTHVSP